MLSVLTLNLWHDAGPYEQRAELVREWIERLDPDLIGFQDARSKIGAVAEDDVPRNVAVPVGIGGDHLASGQRLDLDSNRRGRPRV